MKIKTQEPVAELQGPAAVVVVEELAQEAEAEQAADLALAQGQEPVAVVAEPQEPALAVEALGPGQGEVAVVAARAEPTAWNKNWRKLAA
jgi:hypothetical protein